MNQLPCNKCRHYDQISKPLKGAHGRCAARSVYPHLEAIGQVFPEGVARMPTAEQPAKYHIVEGAKVEKGCTKVSAK